MMNKTPFSLRPAGAAIAAVLALSTPSANAQDSTIEADPLASPVIVPVSPAPPISAPATTTAPSALPDVLRAPPVAPPIVDGTATPPSAPADLPSLDRPLPPVEPVPQTSQPEPRRAVARISSDRSTATGQVARSPRAAGAIVQPVRAQSVEAPSLAPPLQASEMPLTGPEPEAFEAGPVITASTPDGNSDSLSEWALFGGFVGIGGIAAAAALSRRRRPRPEPEPFTSAVPHEIFPAVAPARAREQVAGTAAAPAAVTASVSTLARQPAATRYAGSDTVGRHEAMVDAGPTADNPFLTRRNRLRRARFLDRQEAAAGTARSEPARRYATR